MDALVNSSSASVTSYLYACATSDSGTYVFTSWFAVYILLLPVFLSVLFIGLAKWRKHRSGSTTVSISHCDVFTFHMMALEMLMATGSILFTYGLHTGKARFVRIGANLFSLTTSGQMFFHCLTCVERYLAVVHPITYLRLKNRGGVTVRNVSVGLAWLLSFVYMMLIYSITHFLSEMITGLLLVLVCIASVSFCSVSVLCALIRPRPGDGGGDRRRIDQSKRLAFNTIMAILGVLLMRLVQLVVLNCWHVLGDVDVCLLAVTTFWFSLPSSLVLPLLFLHRAGKLPTCC